MRLAYIFAAKCVSLSQDNTFNVIGGGFFSLDSADFPQTLNSLAIVGHLVFDPSECNRWYRIHLEVFGPSDQRIALEGLEFALTPINQGPGEGTTANCVFNIANIPFPEPGAYQFCLNVDDARMGAAIIPVRRATGQESQP